MYLTVQAACGCHTGNVRKNNEDNFYFNGTCLEETNKGLSHPLQMEGRLQDGFCCAVFDGMGGENFGELASYAAARQMQVMQSSQGDWPHSENEYLEKMTQQLNEAVSEAQCRMRTDRMGTTMVCLYVWGRHGYVCNVGDSRAYRLRDGELLQLSQDHVHKRAGSEGKKAPLTQYVGYGTDEIEIQPHIEQSELKKGDVYLLCSDGLTDMLTNLEITDIMLHNKDPQTCVQALIQSALERGGRDNITAIVCTLVGDVDINAETENSTPLPAKRKLTYQMVTDALCKQRNSFCSYLVVIAVMGLAIVLGTFVFPVFYLFIVNCIISLVKMTSNDIKRKDLHHDVIDRPCIEKRRVETDNEPDVWQLWFNNKDGDLNVAVVVEKNDYDVTELGECFYLVFSKNETIPCLWYRKKEWELDQSSWPPIR